MRDSNIGMPILSILRLLLAREQIFVAPGCLLNRNGSFFEFRDLGIYQWMAP